MSDTVIGHIAFRYVMSNAVKLLDIINGVCVRIFRVSKNKKTQNFLINELFYFYHQAKGWC